MSRCKLNPCCGNPAFCKPPPQVHSEDRLTTEFVTLLSQERAKIAALEAENKRLRMQLADAALVPLQRGQFW